MSDGVLHQGDRRWGHEILGDGPGRIAGKGCVLLSVNEACRRWGGRPDMTPTILNVLGRDGGAFINDNLLVHELALMVGLDAPLAEEVKGEPGDPRLVRALDRALADAEGGAILRVSTDGGPNGRHSILAFGWSPTQPKRVLCADSAPARRVELAYPSLTAAVKWGKAEKQYAVVKVRPIRKLRPTA